MGKRKLKVTPIAKAKKTTLGYGQIMDLDLDRFFADAIRERSLFKVLDSLANACSSRADAYEKELETELHPSVRPNCEDEAEFFREAEISLRDMRYFIEDSWKGRELPTCADGHIRFRSQRSADSMQVYLVGMLTTLNDPNAAAEDWRRTAAQFIQEIEGMIWYHKETGQPNFELAKALRESSAQLVDPDVPRDEKFKIAGMFQDFIVSNYEKLRA